MRLAASFDAEHRPLIGAILERIMVEVRFAPQPGRHRPKATPSHLAAAPVAVALLQADADRGENGREEMRSRAHFFQRMLDFSFSPSAKTGLGNVLRLAFGSPNSPANAALFRA
jgi:hypothetical protein